MTMTLARLVLWCLLGLILDSAGYGWTTPMFWAAIACVWAIEQIVWIEFREALEDYILTQRRLTELTGRANANANPNTDAHNKDSNDTNQ